MTNILLAFIGKILGKLRKNVYAYKYTKPHKKHTETLRKHSKTHKNTLKTL
jgi:hypothetical protein